MSYNRALSCTADKKGNKQKNFSFYGEKSFKADYNGNNILAM